MAEIKIKEVSYRGWDRCVSITNDIAELVITVEAGPRIIRYGYPGKANELCEIESASGLTGGDEWRLYGGHRLWHSPEAKPRTYEPDNAPVQWSEIPGGVQTVQDVEKRSGIRKEMEIALSPDSSTVTILHRLVNTGVWPVEMAVWSITAMTTGGKEVIPFTARDTGLLPNRSMAVWPYTKLNDPRVTFGEKYVVLRHDPDMAQPFKIGVANEMGWAAYFNNNHLFVKYHNHIRDAAYPDFGVSYESYVNDFMLEMESLSPLSIAGPDEAIEHIEKWQLFDDVPMPSDDEATIERALDGKVETPFI